MYKGLRVGKWKKLDKFAFTQLGKVNVICGKNNSGKSTLLEAIGGSGERSVGRVIGPDAIQALYRDTVHRTGWNGDDRKTNDQYREVLAGTASLRDLWFAENSAEFCKLVKQSARNTWRTTNWALPETEIQRGFEAAVRGAETTVLVPAKRHLELDAEVKATTPVESSGIGLLNRLFFLKNQQADSEECREYQRIATALKEISGGYSFDVNITAESHLSVRFQEEGGAWVEAANCGLGLQDLLTLIHFAVDPSYDVILIEEPESHLHPAMQKRLLSFLREETDKQYFLTTHSNVFLNNALVDRVYFTSFVDGQVRVDDATSKASILGDLGYSVTDNLVSDLVILVEGPKDIPVIEELLVKMSLYDRFDIRMWPLGGDIMDQVDVSILKQNTDVIALIDKDPGSKAVRKRFMERCEEFEISVTKLSRYAIENYFTLEALRAVLGDKIPAELGQIDHKTKLEDQIGWNVKKSNREIARRMSLDDIKDTDLYGFLEKVKGILEA